MAMSIGAVPRDDGRSRIALLDPAREYRAHRAELLGACERVLGRSRLAPFVTIPPSDPRQAHVYHQYVVRTPHRDALQAHLRAHDVDAGIHYPVPIHRQRAWLATFGASSPLPSVERAAAEMPSLPVHPDPTEAEVERVADTVARFFR
jgi:dTDP-4-amino-4,6-dideoxygalactose transaminase